MQKIGKNQGAVSEIFKDWRTDGPLTDGQGQLLRTPLRKPWVQSGLPTKLYHSRIG